MLKLMCTLQVLGAQATTALGERRRDDRGQTAAEYLGIIVIVAGILALIAGSGAGGQIVTGITSQITKITGLVSS